MSKPRRRPPKAITTEELASILAYAELTSDKAASEKFNVSARTLQRYRAELRAGRRPELAALVDQTKSQTTKRCEDLLVSVYERGLTALGRRIDDEDKDTRMKDRDLVGAIHILGNQRVTRDALTDDEQQPSGSDRPGASTAAAGAGATAATGATTGVSRTAIH